MPVHLLSHPLFNQVGYPGANGTVTKDDRVPLFGLRLDTSGGHLDYDVAELGVNFDDSSRYNDSDMIGMIFQHNHDWKQGSNVHPHIHWIQNQNAVPNMLLSYRSYDNGQSPPAWSLAVPDGVVFTYVSGSILQILTWPEIDLSHLNGISPFTDIKIYRDTANASGLFTGADPYTGDALIKEYDHHEEKDMGGSRQEYTK